MTLDLLLLFGLASLLGLAGGKAVKWAKVPRVVGYILVGVVLGSSMTNLISKETVAALAPLTDFALALIGFMIGGELKRKVFKRFGFRMVLLMLAEGLSAFVLVTLAVVAWTDDLALAVLLGALSSATAPAATVDVLWEYRSRGPLTTTLLGIVALDDALALLLYGFAIAFARTSLRGEPLSPFTVLFDPLVAIGGALAIGVAAGWLVTQLVRRLHDHDDLLVLGLGAVLVTAGLAGWLHVSLILAEMALGVTLVNLAPNTSRQGFRIVEGVTPPIYILFFILVGARLDVGLLPRMGILGLLYVGARTVGKMAGSWAGATAVHAPDTVRRYLGLALFSQAGVAVGLALGVAQEFAEGGPEARAIGTLVVNVIAATTFLVQVIGPPMVKLAISRAGEIPKEPGGTSDAAAQG